MRNKTMMLLFVFSTILLSILQQGMTYAQLAKTLSYSGTLMTKTGEVSQNGTYSLQFNLYNQAKDGKPIWTETQKEIDITGGAFTVMLGSVNPLDISFNQKMFVELTVLSGPNVSSPETFSPRSELTASAYSLAPWEIKDNNIFYPTGNVGIGTDKPSEKLEVAGAIKAQSFVGDGSRLTGITGASGGIANVGSTTIAADKDAKGSGEITFQTNGQTRMTVQNSGLVKIEKGLIVMGDSAEKMHAGTPSLQLGGNGTIGNILGVGTSGSLHINTSSNNRVIDLDATNPSNTSMTLFNPSDLTKSYQVNSAGSQTVTTTNDLYTITGGAAQFQLGISNPRFYITDQIGNKFVSADASLYSVGIGASAIPPTKTLDVGGEARIRTVNQATDSLVLTKDVSGVVHYRTVQSILNSVSNGDPSDDWLVSGANMYPIPGVTNVGIGTTTPASPLHLNSATDARMQFTASNLLSYVSRVKGAWGATVGQQVNNPFVIQSNSDGDMVFTLDKNYPEKGVVLRKVNNVIGVGINTVNPSERLDINGRLKVQDIPPSNDTTVLVFEPSLSSGTHHVVHSRSFRSLLSSYGVLTSGDPADDWVISGSNMFPVNLNLNVGVGTNTPSTRFSVVSGSQAINLLSGTNTSGYALNVGVNDDAVNFTNTSLIRGFNFNNGNGNLVTITADDKVGIATRTLANPTPHSTLTVNGSFATAIRTSASSTTLTATDHILLMNGSPTTATLPKAAGIAGREYIIKKIDSGSGAVTISPTGSDKIDGGASYVLIPTNRYVTLVSDGTSNWYVIGNN